jgi:hypothetical protein
LVLERIRRAAVRCGTDLAGGIKPAFVGVDLKRLTVALAEGFDDGIRVVASVHDVLLLMLPGRRC